MCKKNFRFDFRQGRFNSVRPQAFQNGNFAAQRGAPPPSHTPPPPTPGAPRGGADQPECVVM